ncbi:hypothetical protein [Streptomyces sp. NPDC048272]|uniref:hypothetical protein n=1 Tax=Streptomyces sp. NPDC048272 TaxID=3154616 RepID=UPI003440FD5C
MTASPATLSVPACTAGIVLNLLTVRAPGVVTEGAAFVGDSASLVALSALGLRLGGAGPALRGTTREELLQTVAS